MEKMMASDAKKPGKLPGAPTDQEMQIAADVLQTTQNGLVPWRKQEDGTLQATIGDFDVTLSNYSGHNAGIVLSKGKKRLGAIGGGDPMLVGASKITSLMQELWKAAESAAAENLKGELDDLAESLKQLKKEHGL